MFTDLIDLLKDYRTKHIEALRNIKPMRWFATEAESLSALMKKASSNEEDTEWEKMQRDTNGFDYAKYEAARIKIAFMAGVRHDMRGQFSVGKEDDAKTGSDFDRHAYSDTIGARYLTNYLALIVKAKSKGAPAK